MVIVWFNVVPYGAELLKCLVEAGQVWPIGHTTINNPQSKEARPSHSVLPAEDVL